MAVIGYEDQEGLVFGSRPPGSLIRVAARSDSRKAKAFFLLLPQALENYRGQLKNFLDQL